MTAPHSIPHQPLLAIIGATGTGKSRLAVELARQFNGEIINGDAMQLYSGLPIITNKIPVEERGGVRHHLLGQVGLEEGGVTVGEFVERAGRVIEEIRGRGRVPVVVGGTGYYTQALLFGGRMVGSGGVREMKERWPVLEQETERVLEELRRVDPVMAERWHPNERRKIQRSLEIYLTTGRKASDVYDAQKKGGSSTAEEEDSGDGTMPAQTTDAAAKLRFPTLLFWPHATDAVLKARLDNRVGTMLENGLISEVTSLHEHLKRQVAEGKEIDRTRGIWVSIGYKEFEPYLEACKSSPGNASEALLLQSIDRVRASTRQYAKRQVRWIRIKLLNALASAGAKKNIFLLDTTDLEKWSENVAEPAIDITRRFLEGQDLPDPKGLSTLAAELLTPRRDYDLSDRRDMWVRNSCNLCNTTAVTKEDWEKHLKSRGHRRAVQKRNKKQDPGAAIAALDPSVQSQEMNSTSANKEDSTFLTALSLPGEDWEAVHRLHIEPNDALSNSGDSAEEDEENEKKDDEEDIAKSAAQGTNQQIGNEPILDSQELKKTSLHEEEESPIIRAIACPPYENYEELQKLVVPYPTGPLPEPHEDDL
ncbi:MAG: hypothetical protein M1824_003101 [Vezdaea acicularis]|nr:MAG: hypothetical protein M1824_003101 [Vezdaea acicularis]